MRTTLREWFSDEFRHRDECHRGLRGEGGCRERKGSKGGREGNGGRTLGFRGWLLLRIGIRTATGNPAGDRGLFRGFNTRTPPPVGGVYRLRATPTCHRGTDTRYQRTLVAPTRVESDDDEVPSLSSSFPLPPHPPRPRFFTCWFFLSSLPPRYPVRIAPPSFCPLPFPVTNPIG